MLHPVLAVQSRAGSRSVESWKSYRIFFLLILDRSNAGIKTNFARSNTRSIDCWYNDASSPFNYSFLFIFSLITMEPQRKQEFKELFMREAEEQFKEFKTKNMLRILKEVDVQEIIHTLQTFNKKHALYFKWRNKYLVSEIIDQSNRQTAFIQLLEKPDGYTEGSNTTRCKLIVSQENLFEVIYAEHISLGHPGQLKTFKAVAEKFANVSRTFTDMFVRLCPTCNMKHQRMPGKKESVTPIITLQFWHRVQIDLIDMFAQQVRIEHCPPEFNITYKYILTVRDHCTSFVQLRALVQKTAIEVARVLHTIFGTFGLPAILQSDNGREFKNDHIKVLPIFYRLTIRTLSMQY